MWYHITEIKDGLFIYLFIFIFYIVVDFVIH